MALRVVLDANVLVPGFVGRGAPARLIEIWRNGEMELIVSEHLLGEVERAYSDPYYASRVSSDQVYRIMKVLREEATGTLLTFLVSGVATQPKDDLILSTAMSADAEYLATRDRQLLRLERYQTVTILHPVDLVLLIEYHRHTGP